MLQTLTQDIGQLRKDLSFSRHVLKANYERQISDRSTELYVCKKTFKYCYQQLNVFNVGIVE